MVSVKQLVTELEGFIGFLQGEIAIKILIIGLVFFCFFTLPVSDSFQQLAH